MNKARLAEAGRGFIPIGQRPAFSQEKAGLIGRCFAPQLSAKKTHDSFVSKRYLPGGKDLPMDKAKESAQKCRGAMGTC